MEQLICKDLSIGYDGSALHQRINFGVEQGSYLCIIGENGAGKSTLVKTLLGLIPTIKGTITMADAMKSTDIGYLPQQTQVQKDFPASVFEVVISGCLNQLGFRPFYNKAEKQKAKAWLEKLGMAHLVKRSYSKLSGGQQQRVLLARALCATSKILLLDEPSAGLDTASSAEMCRTIKALNDDGITIIMITHNLEQVINDATHILNVKNQIVEFMPKAEYLAKQNGGA